MPLFAADPLPVPSAVTGVFSSPVPSGDVSVPGLFIWGLPESAFSYEAQPVTAEGIGWDIGEFRYFNGASGAGGASSVNLDLEIGFLGGIPATQTFPFKLEIFNSDNVSPAQVDADTDNNGVDSGDVIEAANRSRDTVKISNPLPFAFGDYTLTLSFLPVRGLDIDGDTIDDQFVEIDPGGFPGTRTFSGVTTDGSQFSVLEGFEASARVIATITPNSSSNVPDAGSTLALLGSVFASMTLMRRSRR
jgi:hypothetical protein